MKEKQCCCYPDLVAWWKYDKSIIKLEKDRQIQ